MDAIAELIARQALHDLVVTYCRAADRGDEALLASVFFADAQIVTGVIDGTGATFARDIVAHTRSTLRSCSHSISNHYVEIDGSRAAGETYVLAHMLSAGEAPQQTLVGGRYLDRFEQRNGTWRIATRRFVVDWTMSQPSTMDDALMQGSWSSDDPSRALFGR